MSPLDIWICLLPGLILRGYPSFHWDDSSENSMFYFPATPARISASELNSAQFPLRVRFSKSNWTSLRQTCQWGLGYTLWDLNISNYGKYGSIIILCWYIIYTNVFFFLAGCGISRGRQPLKDASCYLDQWRVLIPSWCRTFHGFRELPLFNGIFRILNWRYLPYIRPYKAYVRPM